MPKAEWMNLLHFQSILMLTVLKILFFYILAKYLFLIKTKKYDIKKTKKVDGYGWIRMIIDHNCQCD